MRHRAARPGDAVTTGRAEGDEMADVDPVPEPMGDVAPRARVTRGAGVLGVLAVVAGFAGGFAAGYAAYDDPDRSEVQAVAGDTAEDASGADDTSGAAGDMGSAAEASAETVRGTAVPAGPTGTGDWQPVLPQRLFRRTTDGGLSVRVFFNEVLQGEQDCGAETDWCPPRACNPASYIETTVVGEWSVAQGGAPRWELSGDDPARVLGTISNWYTDEPVFGVIVRTAPAISSVRLTHAGQSDEMEPIDGIAVLAVPSSTVESTTASRPYPGDAAVEAMRDGVGVPVDISGAFTTDPACMPPPPAPPSLPDPGEQPEDRAAAEAAVVTVFGQAFGGDDAEANADAFDDPSGLAEMRDQLRERYPEMLGGRVTYEIDDVVFTSPTEASYYFRPVIEDYSELPRQIGSARLVDGEWKITRATACAMFQLGGAAC
jgi:hypothetical protein